MSSNQHSEILPDPSDAQNFGQLIGLEYRDSPAGSSCIYMPIHPKLRNGYDLVHGGVIMALMDTAGAWAGRQPDDARPNSVTAALNCNFLRAAKLSDTNGLRAQGRVVKAGRNLYFSSIEVFSEPSEQLLATAQGVYGVARPR